LSLVLEVGLHASDQVLLFASNFPQFQARLIFELFIPLFDCSFQLGWCWCFNNDSISTSSWRGRGLLADLSSFAFITGILASSLKAGDSGNQLVNAHANDKHCDTPTYELVELNLVFSFRKLDQAVTECQHV